MAGFLLPKGIRFAVLPLYFEVPGKFVTDIAPMIGDEVLHQAFLNNSLEL